MGKTKNILYSYCKKHLHSVVSNVSKMFDSFKVQIGPSLLKPAKTFSRWERKLSSVGFVLSFFPFLISIRKRIKNIVVQSVLN